MKITSVSSSNISTIGYERYTLIISFKDGGTYEYEDVPESVYNSLMSASSHGSYFSDNIKNVYRCRKIA